MQGLGINVPSLIAQVASFGLVTALVWFVVRVLSKVIKERKP